MELSQKAVRFVIEALEHYQEFHDQSLEREGLSEDDASDLVNDREFLAAIKRDFVKYRDALKRKREPVQADV